MSSPKAIGFRFASSRHPADISSVYKARYSPPERTDIAVVLCHFSASQSLKTLENFYSVSERLAAAGIPCFTAELCIGGEPARTSANYHYRSRSKLFHKENLWNLAAARVPGAYEKLVFTDGDILFSEHDWLDRCSRELDSHDVVAPMEWCVNRRWSKRAIAVGISERRADTSIAMYHPGYAAAARRDWLSKVGFYDRAVVGGGDVVFWYMVLLACGMQPSSPFLVNSVEVASDFANYPGLVEYELTMRSSRPRVSYLKGVKAIHLPHGLPESRRYATRMNPFTASHFAGLVKSDSGVYEWPTGSDGESLSEDYFDKRDEDGEPQLAARLAGIVASSSLESIPVVCISLPRATGRRECMTREWTEKRGVPITFFDALDKSRLSEDTLPYSDSLAADLILRPMSPGERAARMSRYLCATQMLADYPDAPLYVICEDDARPLFADRGDFLRRLLCGFYEHEDTDVLLMHDIWGDGWLVSDEMLFSAVVDIENSQEIFGAVCTAFSRRGLEAYVESLKMPAPADNWTHWNFDPQPQVCCLVSNLTQHIGETTYIGNDIRCTRRVEL